MIFARKGKIIMAANRWGESVLSANELVVSRVLDRWRGHSGVDAPWVHVHPSLPPSLVLYRPSAGRSDQRESHQRRPTGDVKTHCDISLCPAFKLGLRSPRIRLASLLARIPPINNRHALFSLPFRVVEHPSSSTDFAIAIRIDEFALTPLAPRKSALERI